MSECIGSDLLDNSDLELVSTVRKPKGIKKDQLFFDEVKVTALVIEYQRSGDERAFKLAVLECVNLIDAIVLDGRFDRWESLEDVRSECIRKIQYVISKWDPGRGNCYSLFSHSLKNFLFSYAIRHKRREAFNRLCTHEIPE